MGKAEVEQNRNGLSSGERSGPWASCFDFSGTNNHIDSKLCDKHQTNKQIQVSTNCTDLISKIAALIEK
ncbi:MAG: hypothetical protein AB2556_24090 [Candidatus Thiodiazotropha sp.]